VPAGPAGLRAAWQRCARLLALGRRHAPLQQHAVHALVGVPEPRGDARRVGQPVRALEPVRLPGQQRPVRHGPAGVLPAPPAVAGCGGLRAARA